MPSVWACAVKVAVATEEGEVVDGVVDVVGGMMAVADSASGVAPALFKQPENSPANSHAFLLMRLGIAKWSTNLRGNSIVALPPFHGCGARRQCSEPHTHGLGAPRFALRDGGAPYFRTNAMIADVT
jgi:hypothetical protein